MKMMIVVENITQLRPMSMNFISKCCRRIIIDEKRRYALCNANKICEGKTFTLMNVNGSAYYKQMVFKANKKRGTTQKHRTYHPKNCNTKRNGAVEVGIYLPNTKTMSSKPSINKYSFDGRKFKY